MAKMLSGMRKSYEKDELDDDSVLLNPMDEFDRWFEEVRQTDVPEANAMIVSTVDREGHPSARTVLLKAYDADGFIFYTNYESQKGREIEANPAVALTFYWPTLERQVRITGVAARTSPEQSDAYFASRPIGSQIGAVVSPQSQVIPDRDYLIERTALLRAEHEAGKAIVRPDHWGGYRVMPSTIEFWQGRPDRLHDRLRYRRVDGRWIVERLAP